MSEVENQFVYNGLWTDWSEGSLMGKTITTDIRTGTVVVSLLAILASLATTHLWHIVTFLVHQIRANGSAADGLFWQQQVLLRTLPTPSSLMADNMNLWWNWRSRTKLTFLRCLFQIVIAALFVLATLAATLATSFIVNTSDIKVLVKSPNCGRLNFSRAYDTGSDGPIANYNARIRITSSLYTETCYDGTEIPSSCRDTFVKPRMSYSTRPAECPFDKSICLGDGKSAVTFDTGLLSMTDDLGLNLDSDHDIKFRKKTTCSVLSLDGRSQMRQGNNQLNPISVNLPKYQNGSIPTFQAYLGGFHDFPGNATFSLEMDQSRKILSNAALPSWPLRRGDWLPIPELVRQDADTSILFIELDGFWFAEPTEDPLFFAHQRTLTEQTRGNNVTVYGTDSPAGLIGCTEQYQYCHGYGGKEDFCTPLQPQPFNFTAEQFPKSSAIQLAALRTLLSYQRELTMALSIIHPMRLNSRVIMHAVAAPNQWALELSNWLNFSLAMLQISFTDFAVGPTMREASIDQFVDRPVTQGDKELCAAQRMRKSGGFANINYFGLIFIIFISVTFIVIDITLLKILVFMSRFREALAPRIDRWIQDGVLQLQRRAYEAQGFVKWEQVDQEVPVTDEGAMLAELSQSKSFLLKKQVTWVWNAGERQVGAGMVRATLGTVADSRDERTRWSTG